MFVSLFEATVETYDSALSFSCCSGTYSIVNVGQTLESTVFFLAFSLSIPSIILLYHIGVTVRGVIFLLLLVGDSVIKLLEEFRVLYLLVIAVCIQFVIFRMHYYLEGGCTPTGPKRLLAGDRKDPGGLPKLGSPKI